MTSGTKHFIFTIILQMHLYNTHTIITTTCHVLRFVINTFTAYTFKSFHFNTSPSKYRLQSLICTKNPHRSDLFILPQQGNKLSFFSLTHLLIVSSYLVAPVFSVWQTSSGSICWQQFIQTAVTLLAAICIIHE